MSFFLIDKIKTIIFKIHQLKEIIKEISIKNEKTFLTLLVSLGHLAFYIPEIIGLDMKSFITETIFKDILIPTIERSISGDDEISKVTFIFSLICFKFVIFSSKKRTIQN